MVKGEGKKTMEREEVAPGFLLGWWSCELVNIGERIVVVDWSHGVRKRWVEVCFGGWIERWRGKELWRNGRL